MSTTMRMNRFGVLILVVLLPLALYAFQTPEVVPIEGIVVDSFSKSPIADAEVWLSAKPGDNSGQKVTTDSLGRFRIEITVGAVIWITANKEGYAKPPDVYASAIRLEIKPGTKPKPVVVSLDRVGSVTGLVLDRDTLQPIPELLVSPMKWMSHEGSLSLSPAGEPSRTNSSGEFHLVGLAPGEYILQFTPRLGLQIKPPLPPEQFRNEETMGYGVQYFPGVELPQSASPVVLSAGSSVRSIEMKLEKIRRASLQGLVELSPGLEELEGSVRLSVLERATQGEVRGYRQVLSFSLKSERNFRLDGLSPGEYLLLGSVEPALPDRRLAGISSFKVEDRSLDGVVVTLSSGLRIGGSIRFDSTSEEEVDKLSNVAQSKRTRVFFSLFLRMGFPGEQAGQVVRWPEGKFESGLMFPGEFDVTLKGLPEGWALKEIRVANRILPSLKLDLKPGIEQQQLELVVGRADATLRVKVKDGFDAGGPSNVLLVPIRDDMAWSVRNAQQAFADSSTDAVLSGLLPGRYLVLAYPVGAPWRNLILGPSALQGAQEIELKSSATATAEVQISSWSK
ncbi:MAG: carboxypeptidase-like regulatory domain-containing protein [Bryobacter sp.]|nr:carboxypeptidase-like regulatory domain-containing protein [Bryobacter sp.]